MSTTTRRPIASLDVHDQPASEREPAGRAAATVAPDARSAPAASPDRRAPSRLQVTAVRTVIRMGATISWLPVCLAVATVVTMHLPLAGISQLGIVLLGTAIGLLAWLGGSAITNGQVTPDRANSRSFVDLAGRIGSAQAMVDRRLRVGTLDERSVPVIGLAALRARLDAAPPEPGWASGFGYVNAWRELHRIEETLIETAAADELDGILRNDELRVGGSPLDRKGSLVQGQIATARAWLDAGPSEGRTGEGRPAPRPLLRAIRTAVNNYRDRRFEALVRNRMHVDRVSLMLGLVGWSLVCLAILSGASTAQVTGVAALYLVGAAAGLFTQLRSRVSESLEDIFGYGQAQLRQVVLLSGVAGVAGVFLEEVATTASAGEVANLDIATAFEVGAVSLVTAAAFGLAPGTLTDRLSAWAKANLSDLESTASGAATRPG